MRIGAGLAILGLGLAGLGWWAKSEYATHIQGVIDHDAQAIAAGSVHGVEVGVEGRDISVSGLADGRQEHAALIAGLTEIDGQRVVIDRLEVLPLAAPYTLNLLWMNGELEANGTAPSIAVRDALAEVGATDLSLAAGAPDAHWGDAAQLAIGALRLLEDGTLAISERRMSLAGVARTLEDGEAVRAALDQLPEGYQVDMGLRYVDDGTPPAYDLHYTAAGGAWLEGKLPRDVTPDDLAAALGLTMIDDNSDRALTGEAEAVPAALAGLAPWMAQVETLDVSVSPEGTDLALGFGAGADLELLRAALSEALPGVALTVTLAEPAREGEESEEGAQRVNAASGAAEELRGGYWLPVADFTPGAESCEAESTAVLEAQRIGFVSGSARLDAQARGAVNALASVLGACLRATDLQAEIGGHTDNTGEDTGNLALSLARAEAVRAALIARGVAARRLSAEGYGATQPVADNDSNEGRAANRRTAVRWVQ
ncbi:OmpA family protein [Pararhodobacter oceanensis]|uniref:OmpA-like domain-containing protein n=1 Tax=Pararhodobacter oceanensis TaxID=2172121 RepID=A0A2T8HW63_9RHOB|nr:OmpA family protein [Pararhodobacter oceanensis]PVH29658.1 hypothetical protein DDE20_05950 [Pararhodobacter oceanensis]